jgi:hypothetical protein
VAAFRNQNNTLLFVIFRAIVSRSGRDAMNHWQATFLGLKQLPRELSGFEIEAFSPSRRANVP